MRVIRKECALFRGLPLNGFICTPAPPHRIWIHISLRLYYVVVLQTQKCNGEMWFWKKNVCMHYKNIVRISFVIWCWFNILYFELIHGIFLLFYIFMELFFITSMRRLIHLTLLRPLIPIWPWNRYRVPATNPFAPISMAFMIILYSSFSNSFFKIIISTGFILMALLHPTFIWYW